MRDVMETNVNMILGAVINCTLTYLIFKITPALALGVTVTFFCISWTRSYLIRKLFRWMERIK